MAKMPIPISQEQEKNPDGLGIKLLKGSSWLWFQTLAVIFLSLGFTWLLLHNLSPGEFGMVVLTQTILNIANIATLNIELSLMRHLPALIGQKWWRTVFLHTWIIVGGKALLAAISACGLYSLAPFIAKIYSQPNLDFMIRFGILSFFSASLAQVGSAFTLGMMRPDVRALISIAQRIFEVILLGMITFSKLDLTTGMVILILGFGDTIALSAYVLFFFRFLHQIPRKSNEGIQVSSEVLRIFNYTLPLMGARIAEIFGSNIGKVVLGKLVAPDVLGVYSVANLAVERLLPLLGQAPMMAVPILSQRLKSSWANENTNLFLLKLFKYQSLLGAGCNVLIWAFAPLFVFLMAGNTYQLAVPVLQFLGFWIYLWSGIFSVHAFFMVYDRTIGTFLVYALQVFSTIGFYWLLATPMKAMGAALADLVGAFLALVFGGCLCWHWFSVKVRNTIRYTLGQSFIVFLLVSIPLVFRNLTTGMMVMWLIAALVVIGIYSLYQGIPSQSDLAYLRGLNWRYPWMDWLVGRICDFLVASSCRLNAKHQQDV